MTNQQKKQGSTQEKAPGHDIIVIGASAGGVDALIRLTSLLPENLAAAIFIVIHIPTTSTSHLPKILSRSGPLEASHPIDGEEIQSGRIYVAPPNYHLDLSNGNIRLSTGPKEHGHRPAIDPLFHSAARSFGPRAVGVILSGTLGDGAEGLLSLKNRGGIAIVQDPKEAVFSGMPLTALKRVEVDHVLGIAEIAKLLPELALMPAVDKGVSVMTNFPEDEKEKIRDDFERFKKGARPEYNSVLSCPDCGGVIFDVGDTHTPHFVCHVGHAYSPESFLNLQSDALEAAMWIALRVLRERAVLLVRLANSARDRDRYQLAGRYLEQSQELDKTAEVIRSALENLPVESALFNLSNSQDQEILDEFQKVDEEEQSS